MFRRSKRDGKRGSSFTNDSSDETSSINSQSNSLKRASKLFGFGKKDKRKSVDNGSPDFSRDHGNHLTPSAAVSVNENNLQTLNVAQFSPVQENVSPSYRVTIQSAQNENVIHAITHTPTPRRVPVVEPKAKSKSRTESESSSISFDLGTDSSSLAFTDFAADVLRATEEKLKGVDLKLPEVKQIDHNDTTRIVYVNRQSASVDYGFTIRRSTFENGSKIAHIIEPTGKDTLGLLPGDRILEVNEENIEHLRRDLILEKIAKSGTVVKLKLAPAPELAEFSIRSAAIQAHTPTNSTKKVTLARSGSLRSKMLSKQQIKSEQDLESDKSWIGSDKVWLVHKSGFSSGNVSNKTKDDETGEVQSIDVKLDHGGHVIDKVDENVVEKANPPKFDNAENLTSLTYLNESGCLHTLRQRYGSDLVHTYAGNDLIVTKPKHQLTAYTQQVMDMFRGCKQEDMPPHIYATAQISYRTMVASNTNHSIILQGIAGSGKSFNARQLLAYLTSITVAEHNKSIGAKTASAQSVVESFMSARTKLSSNASFGWNLYTLNFDVYGLVHGANIENFMFDKNRVTRALSGESSFRIFYELLDCGDTGLLQELCLDSLPKEGNLFFDFEQQFSDQENHKEAWEKLQIDFDVLNISNHEIKGIVSLLAAILLLGQAGVTVTPGAKPYFQHIEFAQKAASVLGCKIEEIARIIFSTPLKSRNSMRGRSGSIVSRSSSISSQSSAGKLKAAATVADAEQSPRRDPSVSSMIVTDNVYEVCFHALEGLVTGLYIEAMNTLIRLVNRALQTASRVATTINVLDGPGFQNKTVLGLPGSYEDLTKNYCREKVQWFMHYCSFTAKLDRYHRESLSVNYEVDATCTPDITVATLDKITMDRRHDGPDAKGIFWIIEEEALRPNSNELLLVEKIKTQHVLNRPSPLVTVVPELPEVFTISHLQNTVKVAYNVSGWLRKVREHPAIKMAYSLLTESSKCHINDLYAGHQSGAFQNEPSTHARLTGRRRSHNMIISVKKNAAVMNVKSQMERLLEMLDRTVVHFVHCFLPATKSGLIDPSKEEVAAEGGTPKLSFDIPFVRKQFKSSYLLESMRLHRIGFPEHISYPDFRRRFDILLLKENRLSTPVLDEKMVVTDMVTKLDINERSFKLGLSQIFFRAGVLASLEDSRDEKLSDTVIEFQAKCRGFLGRKNIQTLQVQQTALRCLQRNVRKYNVVRHWEWWRLYTKVLPLLDVHRAERELKDKTSELGSLTSTISQLQNVNKQGDEENARLKKKVQELSSQLNAFHTSVSGTGELLEQEESERFRLEEELEQSKMETDRISKQCHQLESELCGMKLNAISNGNYENDDDNEDEDVDGNVWRDKYKALSRELEHTRRRMTDQAEEEIQDLLNQKRNIEKALTEEREDSDEVRRQLTNTKRKMNKFNAEMEDMKLLLETVQSRNSELEKKQRKFDTDVTGLHDQMDNDRTLLETAQRERDKLSAEKHQLQSSITQQEDEIVQLKRKVERLNSEIDDYGTSGKDDAEVVTMRRQLRELETKMQDQEEELDEQAGRIQQLEQAKLRLEMASQRDKQQYQRDIETKDEDMEKVKSDCQRKIRDFEEQVQDEMHRKEDANKVKRELERKVFDLQTSVDEVDRGSEKRLKKELRKYRTLYKDAKKAAENQVLRNSDQTETKALKTQLDDADFAKHMALKAKTQIEADMEELLSQIESITRMKETAEERCMAMSRDNGDLQSRLEEAEDELDEVIRKNKQLISQLADSQNAGLELKEQVRILEDEKIQLTEKVNSLSQKLENCQRDMVHRNEIEKYEIKLQEAEGKWEAEAQSRIKLEHQASRLKGQLERIQDDKTELQNQISRNQQNNSRVERQMKENKMELDSLKRQDAEQKRRREEAETNAQNLEDELSKRRTELNLAEKRIRSLQETMENDGLNSDDDDDTLFDEDSDTESISSSTTTTSAIKRRHSSRSTKNRLSKRGSSVDVTSTTPHRRRPRIPSDDYIFSNGIGGSRDIHNGSAYGMDVSTPSRYTSRSVSRSLSKQVTRQNSYD